jgi:phytoene synthase
MPADFDYCASLVREADRDRYLSALFAPDERRDGLLALYAFDTELTRVRERAGEPMAGEIRLQWWREAMAGRRDEEVAAHPVAAALRETLSRHGLAAERVTALIDAHAFDLYDEPMASLDVLDDYLVRTHGGPIALAADILGADGVNEKLMRHAGIAIGLAELLRGLGQDAALGRLYLPRDLLERHALRSEDILAGQGNDSLSAALAELRGRVRYHMVAAQRELSGAPMQILPALLPAALVGPTLLRMERAGDAPLQFQPLSSPRRQWLLWRAARDPARIFRA